MSYLKLNRKFFENFLWNEARVYSKAEAWLDLIQSARFEASTEIINGKVIELQRGELPASRRFLELRWGWGSTKVSNFLKTLIDLGMINQRQGNGQTIISLVKYRVFNDTQATDKPTTEPVANQRQTSDKPPANRNKEREESKEIKGSGVKNSHPQKSISDRADDFKLRIWEVAKGSEFENVDQLKAFWEYWSEHGENDKKMRFEKQTSFDIGRRLGTWFRNEKKFNPKTSKFKNESVNEYDKQL